MKCKKKNMQKAVPTIKHVIALAVLLLSLFLLSMSTFAKDTKNLIFDNINLDENIMLDKNFIKELINDNIQYQNGLNSFTNKAEIEKVALGEFIYYRSRAYVDGCSLAPLVNPYVNDGKIFFTRQYRKSKKLFSIPIQIEKDGNFSVSLTANNERANNGDSCLYKYGTIFSRKRIDGYYYATVEGGETNYRGNAMMKGVDAEIFDKQGQVVSEAIIMQRAKTYIQTELDHIQYLDAINKDMLSAIFAGNNVYDIDYVENGSSHTMYLDAREVNIEIRFIKMDDKTVYGVYVVYKEANSNPESSSQIYAFKYSDESTPKKQRIRLMTKRVVQNDFDEQYPSTQKYTIGKKVNEAKQSTEFTRKTGLFVRKITKNMTETLDTVYEDFMSEGVTSTMYTKDDNGRFYKNQQEMF